MSRSERESGSDCFSVLDRLAPHLYDIAHFDPRNAQRCVLEVLKEKQQDFRKHTKTFPSVDACTFRPMNPTGAQKVLHGRTRLATRQLPHGCCLAFRVKRSGAGRKPAPPQVATGRTRQPLSHDPDSPARVSRDRIYLGRQTNRISQLTPHYRSSSESLAEMETLRGPTARGNSAIQVEDFPGNSGMRTASAQVTSLALKMVRVSGLWPTKKNGMQFLVRFLTVSGILMLSLTAASYFLVPREVNYETFDAFCCSATLIPVLFNVATLLCKRDQFEEFVSNLKSFAERTTCKCTMECLMNLAAAENKVVIIYLVILSSGFITRIVLPVASYYRAHQHVNSTFKMGLPIGMYPLGEEENMSLFAALYVFQAVSLILTFVLYFTVEVFVFTLIVHTANQFEVLKILIQNIEFATGDWLRETTDGIRLKSLSESKRACLNKSDVAGTYPGDAGVCSELPTVYIKGNSESEKNEEVSCFWRKFSIYHQEALRSVND
ncbi:hypothetical protein PR048_033311 [Dryococelus australis]|uniref:Odorant receptor n=1 Tax=Dryococelus australis TaxID=614101 RepID=A0ABQ9FZY3_9NEOP|nr:hypothetical protein PR048_033311 [Dryococelus australis]